MTPLATHPIAFTVPDVNIDPNMDFQQEFDLFIQQAGIREVMSIEEFFNPAAEDSYTQEELMDEEIIALVQNDESQTDPEEEEEVFSPYQCWSAKDKLTALAQTIAIIESRKDDSRNLEDDEEIIGRLRRVQRSLRDELEAERNRNQVQTSIRAYFG